MSIQESQKECLDDFDIWNRPLNDNIDQSSKAYGSAPDPTTSTSPAIVVVQC
jgi:hypothetical protein